MFSAHVLPAEPGGDAPLPRTGCGRRGQRCSGSPLSPCSPSPSRELLGARGRSEPLGGVPGLCPLSGAEQRARKGLRAVLRQQRDGQGRAEPSSHRPCPPSLRGSSPPSPPPPHAQVSPGGSRRSPRQQQRPGPGGGAAGAVPEPRQSSGRARCLRPAPERRGGAAPGRQERLGASPGRSGLWLSSRLSSRLPGAPGPRPCPEP